ncbi:MAG: hypothetical protein AAGI70_14965 [Pseudomonadota bacterium]
MIRSPLIDALAYDQPIRSAEGMDANHTGRARLQFLAAQATTLITQTQFADAKAAALMTLSGLLAFQGPAGFSAIALSAPYLMVSLGFNLICLGASIAAIVPRFPPEQLANAIYRYDRFSWPGITSEDAADGYAAFMRDSEISQLVVSMARANQGAAHVLKRKFAVLRLAFIFALLSVLMLAVDRITQL